jgi:hypothetical protein
LAVLVLDQDEVQPALAHSAQNVVDPHPGGNVLDRAYEGLQGEAAI